MAHRHPPIHIVPAPDLVDPLLEPLLAEPFASAWADPVSAPKQAPDPLRQRLLARLAACRTASDAMHTVRLRHVACESDTQGVSVRTLYAAPCDRPLRAGEPLRARLVELQPGARWTGPGPALQREWLVLRGSAGVGTAVLAPRDYRVTPAGLAADAVHSESGALLFLREAEMPAHGTGQATTVRDAEAGWPDYAPGIRRRVLWQHDGQAALLYHAEPGASVPAHAHGHDEECLMVQGELFLDDTLLQQGDYQLAPAGTGHRVTETDTGVVIYAHGDLDLKFVG